MVRSNLRGVKNCYVFIFIQSILKSVLGFVERHSRKMLHLKRAEVEHMQPVKVKTAMAITTFPVTTSIVVVFIR